MFYLTGSETVVNECYSKICLDNGVEETVLACNKQCEGDMTPVQVKPDECCICLPPSTTTVTPVITTTEIGKITTFTFQY